MISKQMVAAMLVTIAVVVASAALVGAFRPFSGTSYVTAQADRSNYTVGEDITFKLVAQSSLLGHFRSTGYDYGCGVYINKVPDGLTIDDLVANSTHYVMTAIWPEGSPPVTFSQFNSDSGPLELRWNGMYRAVNELTGEVESNLATSGYYFLYPRLLVTEGDYVVSKIDRSSVFYLNSLNVSMGFSYQEGTGNLTLDLGISDRSGASTNGTLTSMLRYDGILEEQPYSNMTLIGSIAEYLNGTIDLTDGSTWTGTLNTSISPLDSTSFLYEGTVTTERGSFIFGVNGNIQDGRLAYYSYL